MAVISLLMAAGLRMLGASAGHARKTAADTFIGLVEQARSMAISSRSITVLAIAEPGDLPAADERCRIGIFKINEWPTDPTTLDGILIRRWHALPSGTVILPGAVNGLRNPRDEPETLIRYLAENQPTQGRFFTIAFTPRGGLLWPTGSDPVVLRIADGTYRGGQPSPTPNGAAHTIAENQFKIGRIVARPYRSDG